MPDEGQMSSGKFVRGTTVTFATGVVSLLIGIATSVILARVLGPEGKGIYALATLLPALILTFGNLGIGPATVYYVARGEYRQQEILGNDILLGVLVSFVGIIVGLVLIIFFREFLFPDVFYGYLFLALLLIPLEIILSYNRYILLGAQWIKHFNYVEMAQTALLFGLITIALLGLNAGVTGAIIAFILSLLILNTITFHWARAAAGGINLRPNISYMKQTVKYGLQAHLAIILGFLNYRIDMLFISGLLGPTSVGLYSIGVGIVERLWMLSYAASTVLFPRVAAENEEQRRKEFTPLVARTVLWTTAIGALAMVFLSRWIVLVLYSEAYLPAVGALQALLVGTVTLSAGRVLSNDIAGRGRPGLNIYVGVVAVITNVVLNILWIPRYGIEGAAWASTISYTFSFLGALIIYCRLSKNSWLKVILLQRSDWLLYKQAVVALGKWAYNSLRK